MEPATPQTPPAPAPSKAKVFLRRLTSTIILWTIVIGALFSKIPHLSDIVFVVIMVFLAITGLYEFYEMAAKRGLICFRNWGLLGGVLLMVGTFFNLTGQIGTPATIAGPSRVNDFEVGFLILFVLGLC